MAKTPHYTMSIPNGPVCHPDLSAEEYSDGLTDYERAERSKYNFKYNRFGERQYPTKDNHYKYERNQGKKSCRFKIYRGKCVVHTLLDDFYHKDHVIVKFEFQPQLGKQVGSDLNETLLVNFYNPSYDYVLDHQINVGNVYTCDKRKRLTGDCPAYDYDFIELEAMDIDK